MFSKFYYFHPRYFLPAVYLLGALAVIILEWNEGGFLARLGSVIVTSPWSVWIPDWYNFNFSYTTNIRLNDTSFIVLLIGLFVNTGIFYYVGCLMEYCYRKVRSLLVSTR